jgi:hypothetical protein
MFLGPSAPSRIGIAPRLGCSISFSGRLLLLAGSG